MRPTICVVNELCRAVLAGCVLDVGYMITHSGAVNDLTTGDNYGNYLLPFVKNVSTQLQPSSDGTHIGVVTYGE